MGTTFSCCHTVTVTINCADGSLPIGHHILHHFMRFPNMKETRTSPFSLASLSLSSSSMASSSSSSSLSIPSCNKHINMYITSSTPPTITTMTMQQYNKHYDATHRSIKNVMIHCKQNIIGINQLKNQATLKVLKEIQRI